MKCKFTLPGIVFMLMVSIFFSGCEFIYSLLDSEGEKSVDPLAEEETVAPLEAINQTFEGELDTDIWIGSGYSTHVIAKDPVFSSWPQYGDALVDTHGKVYEIGSYGSSLKIQKIYVAQESAVSFDYKCDLFYDSYFRVYVDDSSDPDFEATGAGQMWLNGSVILSEGTHSVTFKTTDQSYGSVYLDNITLAPNVTDSVDIYPKGLQETYVEGISIQFTAKALRSDGSVIAGKNAVWTSSRGTIGQNGLFTPGTSSGMSKITATIDGKSASNENVKIHGEDYLLDPVIINGHEFTGRITNGNIVPGWSPVSDTENVQLEDPTPRYSTFTADGFFVLKGTSVGKGIYVGISRVDDDYKYRYAYFLPAGDFGQRIWLRFGEGEYDVVVCQMDAVYREGYDGYECEISSYSNMDVIAYYRVTNDTGLPYSKDDCAFLMPSADCQSDDYIVSNAFNAVISELPEDATLGQKLQALYDWELRRTHYDFVSTKTPSGAPSGDRRKKQDAVHVVLYEMAVCEGYANLYTALVRLLGVKAAFQGSNEMNHGWTELFYNGEWKLVDVTWDDSVSSSSVSNVEKNPTKESYNYFLIDESGIMDDHYDNESYYSRSVAARPKELIFPHNKS